MDIPQSLPDMEEMEKTNDICQAVEDNSSDSDSVSTVGSSVVMQSQQEIDGLQYIILSSLIFATHNT